MQRRPLPWKSRKAAPASATGAVATWAERLDPALKLGAFVTGVLYVLGMVIHNIHLLTVGISDMSLVQAQAIVVGLHFVAHLIGILVFTLPIAAFVVVAIHLTAKEIKEHKPGDRVWTKCIRVLATTLIWTGALSVTPAAFFAWVAISSRPWGERFDPFAYAVAQKAANPDPSFLDRFRSQPMYDPMVAFDALMSYYWHIWCALPAVLAVFIWVLLITALNPARSPAAVGLPIARDRAARWSGMLGIVYLSPVLAVYLAGYIRDVYPNVSSNLGGGQPDVAQLQLQVQAPLIEGLPMQSRNISKEVIVWHQTQQFIYVVPVSMAITRPQPLIAIELKSVLAIKQVSWAVEFRNGSEVVKVHDLGGNRPTVQRSAQPP